MNILFRHIPICSLLTVLLFISSCNFNSKAANIDSLERAIRIEEKSPKVEYTDRDKMTCGLQDKNGNLWFGTSNEGIFRFDGKMFTNFTIKDGLSSNFINVILEDNKGDLWFGTKNGLCSYNGKSFAHFPIPWDGKNSIWGELCNPNQVLSMTIDKNGAIWLGTCGGGSYRFNGREFTIISPDNDSLQSDSLHHNVIRSITADRSGNIWFSSLTHGGISRYDGLGFRYYSTNDGLYDDMVFSSFEDSKGNLWFGSIQTKVAGLYLYNGKSFDSFGKKDGLCDNFVTGFYEDKKGQLWILTGSVICIFDGNSFSTFKKEGVELKDINFIVENEDYMWFGGKYGRLFRYDGASFTDFTDKGRS